MPVPPRVPDLASLDALVTVARAGSMGAASSRLGISQQAVSARVRSAERLLGLPVFSRSPQGVALTPAGRSVVTWADEVLQAASALDRGAADLRGDVQGATLVAVSNTISECLFPGWAARLRSTHPGARVSVRPGNSDEVIGAVTEASVQLGFVEGPTVPRRLASRRVGSDELVVVVPPDHPWARRRHGIDRALLAATPLVVREPGSGTRRTLEQALPTLAPPELELGSTAAVRDAVLASGVPTVLSSLAVRSDIESGRLVRVEVADLDLPRVLRAVWNPARPPSGLAADLLGIAVASGRTTGRTTR